jgi:taurine dioxygenase
MSDQSGFKVIPSGSACGAEIQGIDLGAGLDDENFRKLDAAFNEHSVVVLRDQLSMSPNHHIALTRRLGGVDRYTFTEHSHPEYPEILRVSNLMEYAKPLGNPKAGHTWHTDQSYVEKPPRCTTLFALEVPEKEGVVLGDTLYASAAAAYEALSDAMKKRLDGLSVVHQFATRKRGGGKNKELTPKQKADHPDVVHPVVRTHPVTGRKCLYVSEGECTAIIGMDDKEALALIDQLSHHITKPDFVYRHKWQKGDLIIWDNCALQHLAILDYAPPLRRHMHRTTVQGTRPQ